MAGIANGEMVSEAVSTDVPDVPGADELSPADTAALEREAIDLAAKLEDAALAAFDAASQCDDVDQKTELENSAQLLKGLAASARNMSATKIKGGGLGGIAASAIKAIGAAKTASSDARLDAAEESAWTAMEAVEPSSYGYAAARKAGVSDSTFRLSNQYLQQVLPDTYGDLSQTTREDLAVHVGKIAEQDKTGNTKTIMEAQVAVAQNATAKKVMDDKQQEGQNASNQIMMEAAQHHDDELVDAVTRMYKAQGVKEINDPQVTELWKTYEKDKGDPAKEPAAYAKLKEGVKALTETLETDSDNSAQRSVAALSEQEKEVVRKTIAKQEGVDPESVTAKMIEDFAEDVDDLKDSAKKLNAAEEKLKAANGDLGQLEPDEQKLIVAKKLKAGKDTVMTVNNSAQHMENIKEKDPEAREKLHEELGPTYDKAESVAKDFSDTLEGKKASNAASTRSVVAEKTVPQPTAEEENPVAISSAARSSTVNRGVTPMTGVLPSEIMQQIFNLLGGQGVSGGQTVSRAEFSPVQQVADATHIQQKYEMNQESTQSPA